MRAEGPAARRLGLVHLRAPLIGFVVTALLTFGATGSAGYAVFVILGPFAGGAAREWQSCCAENSYGLAPYGLGFLAVGILAQLFVSPERRGGRWVRRITWGFASAAWFALAVRSYLHALE